ncbi:TIM barrel protein [Lactovum miscens]|uniref:TIM barrel protein n=1 Tax=Lactovum miscens TaxID=190387 RepID=UPI001606FE39
MFDFTIRGHDLSSVSTFEELALQTQNYGAESLQLALGVSFPDFPSGAENLNPGMGNKIEKILARKGIDIAILSCYINIIHPNIEEREKLLHKFETYVKYAKFFGASLVATETGGVFPEIKFTEKNYTEKVFQETVKVIKRLVKCGEKNGILIGIEPGLNHPVHSLDKVVRLINEVDSENLSIVLDPTNLINADTWQSQVELVDEALRLFGDKIGAFHIKDFIITNGIIKPVNLFNGLMKAEEILKKISKRSPGSIIVLEETKDFAIRDAINRIKNTK